MFAHKNEFAHRMLTDQGCFTHQHVEADFDDGDVESGPSHNSGYPAYDLYEGDSHDLVIDHTGLIADMVLIDWDTFRFFQEMQPMALETCRRCGIAIRPEGGHICGSCGRDI